MTFKPLLAPNNAPLDQEVWFNKLVYPLWGSAKVDGIRSVIKGSLPMSRKGKVLPSMHVQEQFGELSLEDLDGEVTEGAASDPDVYNRTQSHVMSFDKEGDFHFHLFDDTTPSMIDAPFWRRFARTEQRVHRLNRPDVHIVEHRPLYDALQLLEFEAECLEEGYEGIMLRDPLGRYKNGRATFNENIIHKLKRFSDVELEVVGFVEANHNTNAQQIDELGYAKRSSSKEGMVPAGTLGKFLCKWNENTIDVGCGVLTHAERLHIWLNKEMYLGKLLKVRYFGHGVKNLPRFPRAVGWRDLLDL